MSNISDIKEGVVIKGPFWPEEVRVINVKELGKRIELNSEGIKFEPHRFYPIILKMEDLDKIDIISGIKGPEFLANPKEFRLALEAKRIKMSYEFDPLFAVGVSKIDPLPHQIEAVYDYLLKRPRIRFLLADDPGAGKTIMAGLLIKELKYRKVAEKILIVAPPSLISNWQNEMYEKFGEVFTHVNRENFNSNYGTNIFEKENQCITSLDFLARGEGVLDTLRSLENNWDLVIVDEAHKLSAYLGSKDEIKRTRRYKVGEVLAEKSNHLLFLTATPHSGDSEKFRLLLDLLEKDMYANTELVKQAVRKDENPIILRRLKEQMIDQEGNPLFLPRTVKTVGYSLSAKEKVLYDAVTDYVNEHFDKAERSKQRNTIGFALIVLQRRLASSLRAIKESLIRRREKLQDRLDNWGFYKDEFTDQELSPEDVEEFEDLPEEEQRKKEEALMSVTTSATKEELQFEINQIDRLIKLAGELPENSETKLSELKRVLFDVEDIRGKDEKLLIFSEHKDTANYLVERIEQWGFSVTRIDGSMEPGDMSNPKKGTRVWAMQQFNEGETKVLVATEAAGEGINLHKKCSLMINYDVPWNPNRLEQRMGRIHRYGQKKEVHIYNLIATNTREGRVLEIILEKLREMRENLGKDKVYDVIADFIESEVGQRLDKLIRDSIRKRIDPEEFREKMKRPLSQKDKEKLAASTEESLAKQYGPMQLLQKYNDYMQINEEQKLIPEYIEQFFVEAFSYVNGEIKRLDKYLWQISNIPIEVRTALKKKTNQTIKKIYGKVAFSKEVADKYDVDFVAPGTVLFEALSELILDRYSATLQQGAIFSDPSVESQYLLWFVLGNINDGKGRKIGERLFAIINLDNEFVKKGPFIIWDLNPLEKPVKAEFEDVRKTQNEMLGWSYDNLIELFLEEKKEERIKELEIRKKYANLSFDFMIRESMNKINKYQKKKDFGNLAKESNNYQDILMRKQRILSEIEQEKNISPLPPQIMSVIAVVPSKVKEEEIQAAMKRDEEVERIAMGFVIDYEKKQGRRPDDVSSENLGYDIKSRKQKEVRYIEVKGRAKIGDISLSPNEKIKAERFGDKYWLYAVMNCATKPQLLPVQDPANNLDMKKIVEVTRFIISKDEIRKKAEKV